MNDKRLWLAVLAAAVTSALVALCVYGFVMQPALQPMGVTNFDSVTLGKNLIVKGNSTLGDAGSDTVTLTGAPSVAGQLTVSNGITVSGAITMGNSVLTISSAGAFATDSTGSFGSQLTASNGITVGGSITVGNSVLTISSAGAFATDSTGSFGSLLTASNGLAATGGITSTGNVTATGEIQVGTILNFAAEGTITVEDSLPFTPTKTYAPIDAAGEVTPTIETTGYSAGDILIIVNAGSQTIHIADTGTQALSAAWDSDGDDVLIVMFDGTNWVEISRSAN